MHKIITVNAAVSMNCEVSQECLFCLQRETVFHAFMHCNRLRPLFSILQDLFKLFDEVFSMEIFICGFKYSRKRSFKCHLFNFLLGKAKMAIFVSWKRKMEGNSDKDVTMIFFNLGKVKNSN